MYVIKNTETPTWLPELVDQLAAVHKLTVVYVELKYYKPVVEQLGLITNENIRVAVIDQENYEIIPKVEQSQLVGSQDECVLVLGRKVFSSKLKAGSSFSCVYVGDFDPYGDDTQLLQSYVVPNLGVGQCSEISYFSPLADSQITAFKKGTALITKRYANVEKVKEAQIIGILIGTVVCDDYMHIINWLKRAIIQSGKKFYEVLVGKINEPKLRNF